MVEINAARARAGLQPVRFFDSCVDRLATAWGNHIASTGIFAHRDQLRGPAQVQPVLGRREPDPRHRPHAPGHRGRLAASPAHRAILLKGRATRAGLAVVIDGQGRQVGVLNVSRPALTPPDPLLIHR